MHHILGRFLEHDQTIDAPRVETQPIVPIEDKLCEELKDTLDHLIVLVEGIECALDNGAEVLRVQPLKEQFESPARHETSQNPFESEK